ncbi:hypothetical protein Pla123a_16160 [Posidoniimonas polymericola]|uniref:Protease PrsW n=1 Tax=Posidoniimonas polymericola TaxID=2528002 RepID=A0A5C5YSS7_9BACT|nr:PrsW family glutamic-type intramembrane protease [Posidoniimonas polymericola]TWT77820.1 hypothetical protein Pla123a_16160 [Posidoniimonas polymericola]
MSWTTKLARRSHDPVFLWRVAIGIVAAGLLLSFAAPLLAGLAGQDPLQRCLVESVHNPNHPWRPLERLQLAPNADFYQVLDAAALIARRLDPEGDLPPLGLFDNAAQRWDREAAEIATVMTNSVVGHGSRLSLYRQANRRPPTRYANYALAHCLADDPAAATQRIDLLRAEADQFDSQSARERLVSALAVADRWDELTALADNPDYRPLIPPYALAEQAAERDDWLAVLRQMPALMFQQYAPGPAVLALLTGACWLSFLLHIGRFYQGRVSLWLCLAGVALGVVSVGLTLFFILVQEAGWGLEESNELIPGLKYFILGVGLREELAKLLLLLPLIPWLVSRRSELQALIVSACVGLGFAVEENVGYFGNSLGASSLGRLTMANFLHMSLTGLVGLAVCRACWHPKTLGPEAFAVFGVAVLGHGLYDAFIVLPALNDQWGLVTLLIYIGVVYQFFREFRAANHSESYRLSVSFTFTVGVALVTSATYVYLSSQLGHNAALKLLSAELLSSAILIYLFLREAPDSLIDV